MQEAIAIVGLYGYCDESGNTGLNILDSKQAFFWLAAFLSEYDLNKTAKSDIDNICRVLDVEELHINELGIKRVNSISNMLLKIFERNHCSCVFARIDTSS